MGFQLKVFVSDQFSFIALDEPLAIIPANTSAIYTLIDSNGEPVIEDLVLRRKGSDLEIEVDGDPLASISDFYATEGPVTYSVEGALNPTGEMAVRGGQSAVDNGIVWQASATDTQGYGIGAALLGVGAAALAVGAYNDGGSEPDTTAPATSSRAVATDDQGAEQGALTSGDSTDDTALVLSGTNEAGSTVKVHDGAVLLGEAVVDGTTWSYTATVADGETYQLNTTETDTAGNESDATSSFEVTGDTAAPATSIMVVATDDQGAKQGALTSGDSTDDTALVLSGTNEAGAAVEVFNNGSSLGAATVTGTTWSYTATVADGTTYQFNTKETDTAGNESAASSDFTVTGDTRVPTLTLSSPTDNATGVSLDADLVLKFDDDIALGTGNIVITDSNETIKIDVKNHGGQLTIVGDQLTINPSSYLANNSADYHVEIGTDALTDMAGNAYAGINDSGTLSFETEAAPVNTGIVVFDLVNGVSSNHDGGGGAVRTFEADTPYTIYVRVHSETYHLTMTKGEDAAQSASWGMWTGAASLGGDDRIIIVGDGSPLLDVNGSSVSKAGQYNKGLFLSNDEGIAAWAVQWGVVYRSAPERTTTNGSQAHGVGSAYLWPGNVGSTWAAGATFKDVYADTIPAGILTSQGLV
jgi:hypothetical protein